MYFFFQIYQLLVSQSPQDLLHLTKCVHLRMYDFFNLYYEINSNLIGVRYFIFKKLTNNDIPLHQNIQNIRIIKQILTLLLKTHFIKINENLILKNLPVAGFSVTGGFAAHENKNKR